MDEQQASLKTTLTKGKNAFQVSLPTLQHPKLLPFNAEPRWWCCCALSWQRSSCS